MDRFFSLDSPFMRFLNRVADLLILNLLMIACCIPIVTVGAAYTGMYYVLMKIVRGEEGYLAAGFFKSFKQNFRQATVLWLMILLVIVVFAGDILIFRYSGLEFPKVITVLIIAVAVLMMLVILYIFPVLARFDNTIKNTIRNAFFMAVLNLPKTVLIAIVFCLPAVVFYLYPYSGIFIIMFGISLPAYASAYLFCGIFKKFEPEEEAVISDYEFSVNTDEGSEEENE